MFVLHNGNEKMFLEQNIVILVVFDFPYKASSDVCRLGLLLGNLTHSERNNLLQKCLKSHSFEESS